MMSLISLNFLQLFPRSTSSNPNRWILHITLHSCTTEKIIIKFFNFKNFQLNQSTSNINHQPPLVHTNYYYYYYYDWIKKQFHPHIQGILTITPYIIIPYQSSYPSILHNHQSNQNLCQKEERWSCCRYFTNPTFISWSHG